MVLFQDGPRANPRPLQNDRGAECASGNNNQLLGLRHAEFTTILLARFPVSCILDTHRTSVPIVIINR